MLGFAAVALALLSALVTFLVLAGLTPIAPTHEVVVTLLLTNAVTVLLLLVVIAREVWRVVQARRRGRAAARLHVRIVALFSVIAAVPAILVAVVASVTLDRGLDRLFSQQTQSLIENSLIVADAYVREHVAVRARRQHRDRDRAGARQAAVRPVARAVPSVPHGPGLDPRTAGDRCCSTRTSTSSSRPRRQSHPDLRQAVAPRCSPPSTIPSRRSAMFLDANYVAAIIKLRGYDDTYLYIARLLDPRVLAQLRGNAGERARNSPISRRAGSACRSPSP